MLRTLRGVVEAFPHAIHTALIDNGMAFADLPQNRNGPTRRLLSAHIFDRVCREHADLADDAFVAEHLQRWLD